MLFIRGGYFQKPIKKNFKFFLKTNMLVYVQFKNKLFNIFTYYRKYLMVETGRLGYWRQKLYLCKYLPTFSWTWKHFGKSIYNHHPAVYSLLNILKTPLCRKFSYCESHVSPKRHTIFFSDDYFIQFHLISQNRHLTRKHPVRLVPSSIMLSSRWRLEPE